MQNELEILTQEIITKVIKEYNDFKEVMLTKSPIEIFNNAYNISTYIDLLEYFRNDGFSNWIEYRFSYFEEYKDKYKKYFKNMEDFYSKPILATICDIHFNYDNLYLSSWENIDTLLDDYILSKNY